MKQLTVWLACLLVLTPALSPTSAQGSSTGRAVDRRPQRETVVFKVVHRRSTSAHGVYIVGDVPELGDGDVAKAIPLVRLFGNTWQVLIELPTEREIEYRYYERFVRWPDLSDPTNGTPISEARTQYARFDVGASKTFFFHSDFGQPVLHWRQTPGVPYEVMHLEDLGPGRFDGERRLGARNFGLARRSVEFFVTSERDGRRDPVVGAYATPLDRGFLQDGELFTYVPAPTVSPMRRDYKQKIPQLYSSALGYKKPYRVMLPRGYDEHPERRYPVLYLYDGQSVWEGAYYDPDGLKMAALVAAGKAPEMIQVAISSPGTPGRFRETIPPEDGAGTVASGMGEANLTVSFIADELKPFIDAKYRTRTGPKHTLLQGYSQGGVLALYGGWERYDVFGGVMCQSTAIHSAPNFVKRVRFEPKRPLKLYMDYGDKETIFGESVLRDVRDNLNRDRPSWVVQRDVRLFVGKNQSHHPRTGGDRLPEAMTFLLPATIERDAQLWGELR